MIQLTFEQSIAAEQGLPELYAILQNNTCEIRWFGQLANRLPQAYWLKFQGQEQANWEIRKLGQWIEADDVLYSPLLAATDFGVRNCQVTIESLDAALVAPYGRRLLTLKPQNVPQDMYFNLYNNLWGCNHPMWYSDDSRFRFIITPRNKNR